MALITLRSPAPPIGGRAEASEETGALSASAVHPRELPAGDVDDLAVDVVGVVGAEQQHRPRGLLGLGQGGPG